MRRTDREDSAPDVNRKQWALSRSLRCGVLLAAVLSCGTTASAQEAHEEPLSGSDAHEHALADRGHLFGEWGGRRQKLLDHGVALDVQYVSDSLWNLRSDEPTRAAVWDRVRGTADLDLERLAGWKNTYVHVTALWQAGGNMGQYLGLVTGPSGMSSENTFRLDSWWLEHRFQNEKIAVRVGQFAGQDFYGAQHFAASFIFEPMGYALSNLSNTYEGYDPPSTPAAEVRVAPLAHAYVKAMVMAGDRTPYSHNHTGLVPQFKGAPVVVTEIGFSPGKKASEVRAFDNVESRKGYSGLYQLGAAYNPGKFPQVGSLISRSGNELIYVMASQALYRTTRESSRGLDATAAFDWSPADANLHNQVVTAGLRFNEPLPLSHHNTIALGYVHNGFSTRYADPNTGQSYKGEDGAEVNFLYNVNAAVILQPVLQYYANAGGSSRSAVVFGFRTRIDF